MKLLHQGAEAKIFFKDGTIIKERIKKDYRHEIIDSFIRKKTTRNEIKLLEKAKKLIYVPKIIDFSDREMTIKMEFIEGKKLRDVVDAMNKKGREDIFFRVGKKIAKLHNEHIIHGDLTTSNMILKDKIYFIDFGLGFVSTKVEDKAVDLHLIKKALESKHYKHAKESFDAVLKGYKKESGEFDLVWRRMERVEGRGRYKGKRI